MPFPLNAQSGDGFRVQERAGIALIKPQPWSKDNEATVLEFAAFTDRTVKGTVGAGYFEFRTKQTPKRQVPVTKVVDLYVYPEPEKVTEIVTPEERAALGKEMEEMQGLLSKYPATRTYLQPYLKTISAEAAQFDSGKVKTKGKWVPAQQLARENTNRLLALLKSDVERTRPISNMDLQNDPKYLALITMGATQPEVKRQVEEIRQSYDKLLRVETRIELLTRLNASDLSADTAEVLVLQLKGLRPEEDTKSADFVKRWEAAAATNASLAGRLTETIAAFEEAMKPYTKAETPPEVPAALAAKILQLTRDLDAYVATNPPPQLVPSRPLTAALQQCSFSLQDLKRKFEERKIFDAKISLDKLTEPAKSIGPNTVAVIASLGKAAARQAELFAKLKTEAALLAGSGKKKDALLKYEAAAKLVSDDEVKQQIAQLKAAPASSAE